MSHCASSDFESASSGAGQPGWRHATPTTVDGILKAKLPLATVTSPLWVYANVTYPLEKPITGAGYYYRTYTADRFNVSSLLQMASPAELEAAGTRATRESTNLIESFQGDWEKEWFTYRPTEWSRTTNKLADESFSAPDNAVLAVDVLAERPNRLAIVIDDFAAEVQLIGGDHWQSVVLTPQSFQNADAELLKSWKGIRQLRLTGSEQLRPPRTSAAAVRNVGGEWIGTPPRFRNLRWQPETKRDPVQSP